MPATPELTPETLAAIEASTDNDVAAFGPPSPEELALLRRTLGVAMHQRGQDAPQRQAS